MLTTACQNDQKQPAPPVEQKTIQNDPNTVSLKKVVHAEWSKNASIYEVNIRQYTPEGTFKAFEAHLPRLKELGVDILWLMPINPIGEKNRKGSLGSYYAVKDYKGVNPEFGTLDDFKNLVKKIHELGMYVIIDWVPNHTAWDCEWATKTPDWYTRNHKNEFVPPLGTDWADVIELNYDNTDMRAAMIDALQYWVKEADIDGYRCDVAGYVPTDFWNDVRKELDQIKPVFMLAEWEARDLHYYAFDMTYSWKLHEIMQKISKKEADANAIASYIYEEVNTGVPDAYRMTFVDNHDKNSWEGTMQERFGKNLDAFMVLTATLGMPLVYSGQEANLDRPLKFFEKDQIDWKEHPNKVLIQKLLKFHKENPVLWNGLAGGKMEVIQNADNKNLVSFLKKQGDKQVVVLVNVGDKALDAELKSDIFKGTYTELFSGKTTDFADKKVSLPAYGYQVFYN